MSIQQKQVGGRQLAVESNELKNRGLDTLLIAVVDGLRGFSEVVEAVYACPPYTGLANFLRTAAEYGSISLPLPIGSITLANGEIMVPVTIFHSCSNS